MFRVILQGEQKTLSAKTQAEAKKNAMTDILKKAIKFTVYFLFGYIPLLLVCIVISMGITAIIVQSIDYCYGSMACIGHGFGIMIAGFYLGIILSLLIVLVMLHKADKKGSKPKRKHKQKRT